MPSIGAGTTGAGSVAPWTTGANTIVVESTGAGIIVEELFVFSMELFSIFPTGACVNVELESDPWTLSPVVSMAVESPSAVAPPLKGLMPLIRLTPCLVDPPDACARIDTCAGAAC